MENSTETNDYSKQLENLKKAVRVVVNKHTPWYKKGCVCDMCVLKDCLDKYETEAI